MLEGGRIGRGCKGKKRSVDDPPASGSGEGSGRGKGWRRIRRMQEKAKRAPAMGEKREAQENAGRNLQMVVVSWEKYECNSLR